jgi:hypothetical protein
MLGRFVVSHLIVNEYAADSEKPKKKFYRVNNTGDAVGLCAFAR